jgi:predicted ArsR family transcriptional regulator
MNIPNWKQQFFSSTRGRIVELLRSRSRTVHELAEELHLSENAVRSHLSTLERDGLVKRSGERRGARRPFATYDVTLDAEQLFPKACEPILRELLNVLTDEGSPRPGDQILSEVGHRVAANYEPTAQEKDVKSRVEKAFQLFQDLGGIAKVEEREGTLFFQGYACPLSFASVKHPEVCQMFEVILSDILGTSVHERCNRQEPPHCSFEIPELKIDSDPSTLAPQT